MIRIELFWFKEINHELRDSVFLIFILKFIMLFNTFSVFRLIKFLLKATEIIKI